MQLGYCYSSLNSLTISSDSCAFEGILKYVSLQVAHNAAQVSLTIFDIVARPILNATASWLSYALPNRVKNALIPLGPFKEI